MRIGLVNTELSKGGAARAMLRTATALRALGHETVILTLADGTSDVAKVVRMQDVTPRAEARQRDAAHRLYNEIYVTANRSENSNTLFWTPAVGFKLGAAIKELELDVVNIHWSSYFLSLSSLAEILAMPAPTVFTLHDMAHFTGGCHYSGACRGFETNCYPCPQLRRDPLGVPREVRTLRAQLYAQHEPWAIAPSQWLADEAGKSGMFRRDHVRVVSNALDCNTFSPQDRRKARAAFGIPEDARVVMFGAFDNGEHRKGFDLLTLAMQKLAERADLSDGRPLVIFGFGNNLPEMNISGATVVSAGYISEDRKLAQAYSACDVIAIPSRQDNQPNVMLEGMACGTPVAGFRLGGLPDLIEDGVSGALADPFSTASLAEAVGRVLLADDPKAMRAAARSAAVAAADPINHARNYLSIFSAAIEHRSAHSAPVMPGRRPSRARPDTISAPSVASPMNGSVGKAAVRILSWLR